MATAASGRELLALACFKAALGACAIALGFDSISDDDYSRVVIAQKFAHEPALDPSGASWLPLPFWLNGALMMVLGTELWVARGAALVWGALAIVLVRVAAGWLLPERKQALAGTLIVALLPGSIRLGAATVPELPTAALGVIALAAMRRSASDQQRLWGGLAFLGAGLCRYEPWFLSAAFSAVLLFDARRDGWSASRIGALGLSLAAPVAWILHNQLSYGDPLRFLHEVVAYQDQFDRRAWWPRVSGYPWAAVKELELWALLGWLWWQRSRRGAGARVALRPLERPLWAVGFLFLCLYLSALRGGGPTHHLERALLSGHLLLALIAGAWTVELSVWERLRGSPARLAAAALALGLLVWLREAVVAPRLAVSRTAEIALGREVARELGPGDLALVRDTWSYAYAAVLAGSGRPWQFVVEPGPVGARRDALPSVRPRFLIEQRPNEAPRGFEALGARGEWTLFRAPPE